MKVDDLVRGFELRELLLKLLLLRFEYRQTGIYGLRRGARADRVNEALDLCRERRETFAVLAPFRHAVASDARAFFVIRLDRCVYRLRMEQLRAQALEHAALYFPALGAPAVVAGAALAVVRAADMLAASGDISAAAHGAAQQPGEEMARAVLRVERQAAVAALERLCCLPEILRHDAELGNGRDDPRLGRVRPRDAPLGIRVLDHGDTVPHQLAAIQSIKQNAVPALRMAIDRARVPQAAGWRWDTLGVERGGDRARAPAPDVVAEDAPDDLGLGGVDAPLAAQRRPIGPERAHHVIPIGTTAGAFPCGDSARRAAAYLLRQVLEEERVHRALEPDVQLVHRAALGEGDERDPQKLQPLVQASDVFLVARHPIEAFRDHRIEAPCARRLQQLQHLGPRQQVGSGDRIVGIDRDDGGAELLAMCTADPDLVVDGALVLLVVGITSVNDGAHARIWTTVKR